MSSNEQVATDKGGIISRFCKPSARWSAGALVIIGGILGVVFWGGFNWAMEMTNTETFCISCHEMKDNVYKEYTQTIHYNNRSGVRAICTDCHVPKEWTHKVIRKIKASNELLHKVMGSVDTKEKFETKRLDLASRVWATMRATDSRECRNCHGDDYMDFTRQQSRASKRHEEGFDNKQTCIDCHRGIAHKLPAGAQERYQEIEKQQGPRAGIENYLTKVAEREAAK
jgi:cytochrome c-type protein NapC